MFNLGAPEMVLLGILALVLFGPRRLPELGRALGEGLAAFRDSSRQLSHEFRRQLEEETATPQPPPSIPAQVLMPPTAPVMPLPREAAEVPEVPEVEVVEGQIADSSESTSAVKDSEEPVATV